MGYLPFLSNEEPVYKTMKMLAKTYGPVCGFYVGPNQPFISVVGPLAVMEALNNEDLNGRPSNSVILARTFGEKLGLLPYSNESDSINLHLQYDKAMKSFQVWFSLTGNFGVNNVDSPFAS